MASRHGVRALLGLHQSVALQHSFGIITLQMTSTCHLRRLCSSNAKNNEPIVNPENVSLLDNLNLMGVDVKMARQRQPGVFRKALTNEQGVARFLQGKGASLKVIASIISRYPRVITRSIEHLDQRWEIWRNIFNSDAEVVRVMDRSPESFFRSSDNGNLEKNVAFLTSLGLDTKALHRLLTTAPRTFSNSLALNRQMVEFLEDICAELGGQDPEQFSKAVIARNVYILTRSTKRVKANIGFLRTSLELGDSELLGLLQGPWAEILDLSNENLKINFNCLQQRMVSHGCQKADLKKLIISHPMVLYFGAGILKTKLDCLLNGGITVKQILGTPKVLDFSTKNITERLKELQRVDYDFQKYGINMLECSQKRFDARLEKLAAFPDD